MPLILAVTNLDLSVSFYRDLLQQRVLRTPSEADSDHADLLQDGFPLIRLVPRPALQQRHPVLLASLNRHPAGLGLLVQLQVDEWSPLIRRLEKDSRTLLYEREDREIGEGEVWLHDPDGYLVSLTGPL